MKKTIVLLAAVILLTASISAFSQTQKVAVPLSFDFYYTYEMLVDALQKLNKAFPGLTKLEVIGKSEEDRAIYGMTVNNPKTGDPLSKPAIYVDGNIHGNEIQAGEVCLYTLNYILTKYGNNPEITKLVDRVCFYVIPVVNVDGRYHFFKDGNTSSSNRGLRRPKDDDRDGLFDEDPYDDLDGDGNICQMRKRDPQGRYRLDIEDPRLLVRVKDWEKGEWTLLGSEGIDNDGDGRFNEDSEGYVDGNRNWNFNWAPRYVQGGAGDYPNSGTGIKAIVNWIMARPNICMGWAFHNSGGMFLRGPGNKTEREYPRGDIKVLDYLGANAERAVPGYRYLIGWKDLYGTYGGFTEFLFKIAGSYAFVGELFQRSTETFKTRAEEKVPPRAAQGQRRRGGNIESQRERLKFNDHMTQGEQYKEWKPYKHPTYGDIEIGGWVKFSSRLPHPFMLKDLVHRNTAAVIYSAKHLPEVTFEVFDSEKVGKDLYRVRTRLKNSKAISTMTSAAVRDKLYPQDMLKVSGPKIKVVEGGRLTDKYSDRASYKKHRPEVQFLTVQGFGTVEHQFLISGKGDVTFKYESRHARNIEKTVKLK